MTADDPDPDTETSGPPETPTSNPTETSPVQSDRDLSRQPSQDSGSETDATPGRDASDIEAASRSEPESPDPESGDENPSEWTKEIPQETVEEASRLTRVARRASDPAEATAYRRQRDQLISGYGFDARVRDSDDTLVCYPAEWIEDGKVRLDRVTDRDRAIEAPLSGSGDSDEWDSVEAHNAALVTQIRAEYGKPHAANARALADFMGNHYTRRMNTATPEQLEEFRTEYYRRNVWPSDNQRELLERTLQIVGETTEE